MPASLSGKNVPPDEVVSGERSAVDGAATDEQLLSSISNEAGTVPLASLLRGDGVDASPRASSFEARNLPMQ